MTPTTPQLAGWIALLTTLPLLSMADEAQLTQFGNGVAEFGVRLYQELESQHAAFVFSPVSIHTALTMLWMGAGGSSAEQLQSGLRLAGSQEEVLPDIYQLLSAIQEEDNSTMIIANRVFIQKSYEINKTYLTNAENFFYAGIESVDFLEDPEGAARTANQWVEHETRGVIKHILEDGVVTRDTRLLLVNAIYFKGLWANRFHPTRTSNRTFYLDSTRATTVPMMEVEADLSYDWRQDLDCKILKLPYVGDISLVIFLPNKMDGLQHLEDGLKDYDLSLLVPKFEMVVNVTFPKARLESNIDLVPYLRMLNITDIFDTTADLSGISEENNLFVSGVAHKALIEIDEAGTEAAAASGVVLGDRIGSAQAVFFADHPFMFLLVKDPGNIPLFVGRYVGPQ